MIEYTTQYNENTRKVIIVKHLVKEGQTEIDPKPNYKVIAWVGKRETAIAYKNFIENYIETQRYDVFNWKASYDKISWICELLQGFYLDTH